MIASVTCMASSRVGTSTRPSGWFGVALRCASFVTIASPKANVFPEPVWPRPSTSRPLIASGKVFT